MKYPPRRVVHVRAVEASLSFPEVNLWWAQVTVTPEARSTAVLSRGTEKGLIGSIPGGGQVQAICGVGARLLWKKAQKKPKKNMISEIIKRIIPNFSPLRTKEE